MDEVEWMVSHSDHEFFLKDFYLKYTIFQSLSNKESVIGRAIIPTKAFGK